jgi:hypothetical protein
LKEVKLLQKSLTNTQIIRRPKIKHQEMLMSYGEVNYPLEGSKMARLRYSKNERDQKMLT